MKRLLCCAFAVLCLVGILPVAAQDASALDWIPAGFTGYVRVTMTDPQTTLRNLNLALFIASVFQPRRASYSQTQNYDNYFPLDVFDMENASFTNDILPWLKGEVIIAYRRLDAHYLAGSNDRVIIFPTVDPLESGTLISKVLKAQDFPKQETYHGVIVYQGDKTAFAFTPLALLVGPVDLLHEVIDTISGGEHLTADPIYQAVQAALPAKSTISAYIGGASAADALDVLLSGGAAAEPMLTAIHQSFAGLSKTPDRLLMGGTLDGVGLTIDYDELQSNNVVSSVVLHTLEAPDVADSAFDPAVLNLIPRSAMFVQSGTNAGVAATDALHTLPFANFATEALAAFPVNPPPQAALAIPSAQQAQDALSSFLDVLKPVVDVQSDLLDKLDGSYSLALLPRPNDMLPGIDAPFDLLLVVQTDSPESAQSVQASAGKLLETFTAPLESEQVEAQTFQTLRVPGTGEALIQVGAVDNMVVIGTGSAAQLALDARRGDNQLIKQVRWQNLSADNTIPYVYVDVNAVYNTFLPTIGGPAVRPVSQLGIHSRYLGNNLFKLDLLVALSQ